MPYNGASNGSGGVGGAVAGSSVSGGGATIVVSEGPQNKKIRTGVQQPGENDVNMHARSTQNQNQQQALLNKSNDDLRRKRPETTRPNHILLFTIINPFYPITVDVLHKICNPHGQVLRIVIFKKNGVQAMVEFDNLDSATRARENLNGADIYAGCCTLKIDFAKPEKLNVYKNESDTSWDYTLSTVLKKGCMARAATQTQTDSRELLLLDLIMIILQMIFILMMMMMMMMVMVMLMRTPWDLEWIRIWICKRFWIRFKLQRLVQLPELLVLRQQLLQPQ
ncbi:uncharacterized protein LOC6568736 isoform X18 [Drosophila grimshawi]|uniref:uncharacterized protein LOC6568736 isoform X18 n=1 Tax=Drosophila grimshawi TaxID=7222 RepID=UPI000C8704F1|nr:uncharacterized protein LOC6568736 isoform X18 [Drosophila grimshawi]